MPRAPQVLVEGRDALDHILGHAVPRLVNAWNGDEAAVGLVYELAGMPDSFGIGWGVREQVVEDLRKRSEGAPDPTAKRRFLLAATTLIAPPSMGHVSCLVSGWGDVMAIELEADDLRTGTKLTSWKGGSA